MPKRIFLSIITLAVLVTISTGCASAPKPNAEQQALAKEAVDNIRKAQNTPGQEAANYLENGWLKNTLPVLMGEKPAESTTQLDYAVDIVKELSDTAGKGPTWPKPIHIKLPYAKQAPKIDGKLDDEAWKTAATFSGVYLINTDEKLTDPATNWKILWDDKYLYFAFVCADKDIIAPEMKRDEAVFRYDCVEIFIQPSPRTGMYWEIVISPTGMIFDALHNKKPKEWGAVSREGENVEGMQIGHAINGTPNDSSNEDKGYTVEVAVPFDQLPEYSLAKAKDGNTLTLMLTRINHNGGSDSKDNKVYAFIPLLSWGHNVWNYASVELVK